MEYLDFELPIKELEDQLDKCQIIGQESDVDVTNTCKQIEKTKGNLPFTGSNDAKNVQKDREIVKKSQNQSFTGFNEETYWNDAFNQYNSYTPTDTAKK